MLKFDIFEKVYTMVIGKMQPDVTCSYYFWFI